MAGEHFTTDGMTLDGCVGVDDAFCVFDFRSSQVLIHLSSIGRLPSFLLSFYEIDTVAYEQSEYLPALYHFLILIFSDRRGSAGKDSSSGGRQEVS